MTERFGRLGRREPGDVATDTTAGRQRERARPIPPVLFYLSALATGLFLVRVLGEPWGSGFPKQFPDSFSFTKVADLGPLFHITYFFDERPIGFPTLLWLVGRSSANVVVAQTLIYCAAFLALCWVAFQTLRHWIAQTFAIALFVLLAIQPRFAQWNTQVLSESLSLSLAVLMIAAWWWAAVHAPRGIRLAWVATAAWMLTRDGNVAPVFAAVVPAALALGLWSRADRTTKRRLLWGAGIMVLLGGYVFASESSSGRNRYPMHNNIGMRVLLDPEMTEFFVDAGMPLDDTLRGRTGKDSWADGPESFLENPALEEYRDWAESTGRRRLLVSLVVKAPYWYDRLTGELPLHLKSDLEAYDTFGVQDRLPKRPLGPFGSPSSNRSLVIWTAFAVAGLVAASFERGRRALVIFGAAGLLSAYVDIYVSYTGDALEVGRHLVGPLGRLSVMLIACVAIGIDALLRRPVPPADADETAGEEPLDDSIEEGVAVEAEA